MKISKNIPAEQLPSCINENVRSLEELTGGCTSGIIIYDEKVLVCDWAGLPGLPEVTFSYDIILEDSEIIELTDIKHVDDIRSVLPGTMEYNPETRRVYAKDMDLLHADKGDLAALFGFQPVNGAKAKLNADGSTKLIAGTCYELAGRGERLIVVAPDDWD